MDIATLTQDTIASVTNFFTSPAGKLITQQALDVQDARTLEERRQLVKDIAALEASGLVAAQAYEKALAPMLTEIERGKAVVVAAERRRDEWRRRRGVDAFAASLKLDRMRGRLQATAPREAIDGFCADMREHLERLRLQADAVNDYDGYGRIRSVWDNYRSTDQCRDAIERAINGARALATEPLAAAELEARFEALRQSIPAVESRPSRFLRGDAA